MSYSRFWPKITDNFDEIGVSAQQEQRRCIPDDNEISEVLSPGADKLKQWKQQGLFGKSYYKEIQEESQNLKSACRISPFPDGVS